MPQYSEQEKNNITSANSLFDGSCGDPASLFAEDAIWWNGLPRLPGLEGKTEHKGIETIKKILYGAGQDQPNSGTDSYDLSTNRFTDLLVIADNDYVMRQHTQHSKTNSGKDYKNVYCFVFRFNDQGKIQYLTEHWNTWYANKILLDNWDLDAAHPND